MHFLNFCKGLDGWFIYTQKVMIVGFDLLIFLYAFPWILDFPRVTHKCTFSKQTSPQINHYYHQILLSINSHQLIHYYHCVQNKPCYWHAPHPFWQVTYNLQSINTTQRKGFGSQDYICKGSLSDIINSILQAVSSYN